MEKTDEFSLHTRAAKSFEDPLDGGVASERTHRPRTVLRMVIGRAAVPMAAGITGGLVAIALLGRIIAGMLMASIPSMPW